jgi:hypothetical protein
MKQYFTSKARETNEENFRTTKNFYSNKNEFDMTFEYGEG